MTVMADKQGGEMSEDALKGLFGKLVEEALVAFSVDSNYATDIISKARAIQARRSRKAQQLNNG